MSDRAREKLAVPFAPPGGETKYVAAQARQAAAKNRRRTPLLATLATAWLCGIILFFVGLITHQKWALEVGVVLVPIQFAAIGFASVVWTDTDKQALNWLAKRTDMEAVDAILECLRDEHTFKYAPMPEYKNLRTALIALLPRLQASDAAQFSLEQRTTLYKMLDGKDAGVVFVVLKALEQIGDANALPYVARLAEGRGQARRNPALREAAAECLLYLEPIAARGRTGEQLLRPAMPAPAPDVLLRPALPDTQPTADGAQLLRANIE